MSCMFHLDFDNPNVTLTCFNNTITVEWHPVHKLYDTYEDIAAASESVRTLQYCIADIYCDSGYSEKVGTYTYIHMYIN